MDGDVVVLGPPQTLGAGHDVVRVVAAYCIGVEVGVLIDAFGTEPPTPPHRADPFVVAVDVVIDDGTEQPCVALGGVVSSGDQRTIAVSSWRAPAAPRRVLVSVQRPEGIHVVELSAPSPPQPATDA